MQPAKTDEPDAPLAPPGQPPPGQVVTTARPEEAHRALAATAASPLYDENVRVEGGSVGWAYLLAASREGQAAGPTSGLKVSSLALPTEQGGAGPTVKLLTRGDRALGMVELPGQQGTAVLDLRNRRRLVDLLPGFQVTSDLETAVGPRFREGGELELVSMKLETGAEASVATGIVPTPSPFDGTVRVTPELGVREPGVVRIELESKTGGTESYVYVPRVHSKPVRVDLEPGFQLQPDGRSAVGFERQGRQTKLRTVTLERAFEGRALTVWTHTLSEGTPPATPLALSASDGKLFLLEQGGKLSVFDAKEGARLWTHAHGASSGGKGSAKAASIGVSPGDRRVYVFDPGASGSFVNAFDSDDGVQLWRAALPRGVVADDITWQRDERGSVVLVAGESTLAFDPSSGMPEKVSAGARRRLDEVLHEPSNLAAPTDWLRAGTSGRRSLDFSTLLSGAGE